MSASKIVPLKVWKELDAPDGLCFVLIDVYTSGRSGLIMEQWSRCLGKLGKSRNQSFQLSLSLSTRLPYCFSISDACRMMSNLHNLKAVIKIVSFDFRGRIALYCLADFSLSLSARKHALTSVISVMIQEPLFFNSFTRMDGVPA